MITPADLRAMRMRLGLTLQDAAQHLGMKHATLRAMEDKTAHHVHGDLIDAYLALDDVAVAYTDHLTDYKPPVLLVYSNIDEFQEFEPDAAACLRINAVQRMAVARAQQYIIEEHGKSYPPIVEVNRREYLESLGDRPHTMAALYAWAAEKAKTYHVIRD